jgi:hypothetical protein
MILVRTDHPCLRVRRHRWYQSITSVIHLIRFYFLKTAVRIHLDAHIRTIVVLTGGKLTVQLQQMYGVIFGIFLNYFVVYEAYFIVDEFCRTIRVASVYFVVLCLILLFMNRIGLSGYFRTGPLWT